LTRNWWASTRRRPTGSDDATVALGRARRRLPPSVVGHATGHPALRISLAHRTPLSSVRADARHVRAGQGPLGRVPALARLEPAGGAHGGRSRVESAADGTAVDAMRRPIRGLRRVANRPGKPLLSQPGGGEADGQI